ncbi:MAG: O-antigen ligase family protein, partial [Gammaproteobacteria bacterium]|nr:O-antigen ligase family protein [Gammaproteobacteria bacterium]
ANNQGGLFNLVAFLLFTIYWIAKPPLRETTRGSDVIVNTLVGILFVSNMLGLLVRNPMPVPVIGLEAATFAAYMLAFRFASSLRLTEARLRNFMIVAGFMAAYNFAVSLNQNYGLLYIDTPLLGMTRDLFYATSNAFGTFGSASSNGQYAMMLLALILPLLAASASQKALNLSPLHFVPIAVMSGLTLILANMRAAALESAAIVVIYTVMFSLMHRRAFRNAKYVNMASTAVIVVLATVGVWFNLENIARDFEAVQVEDASSIESGKALNRFGPWQYGWERLQRESWWIGYGHGNDQSNQIAWGGRQMSTSGAVAGGGHLHNLYLALPMMYGWVGALAYVLLFLVVVFRLLGSVRRYGLNNIKVVTCLGFLVSLAFFLLDEIKSGNAVQTVNYAMVAWIWLGLGLAAHRTLLTDVAEERARRQAAEASGDKAEGKAPATDRATPHKKARM